MSADVPEVLKLDATSRLDGAGHYVGLTPEPLGSPPGTAREVLNDLKALEDEPAWEVRFRVREAILLNPAYGGRFVRVADVEAALDRQEQRS